MGLPYTILIVVGFFFVAAAGFVFAWEAGRRRLAWCIATAFVAVAAWSVYEIAKLFIPSP